jgi:probable rRNA maturation factor
MSSPEGSTVTFRRTPPDFRRRAVELVARRLQKEVAKGRPFECLIAGDADLRRLNREFRGQDYPTDVLSFPAAPPAPDLGSLAISYQRARAQAREFGHDTEHEVAILMLHGLLHLLGLDHETDGGRMARAEKRWRTRLGLAPGLIERARGLAAPSRKPKSPAREPESSVSAAAPRGRGNRTLRLPRAGATSRRRRANRNPRRGRAGAASRRRRASRNPRRG